MWHIGKRKSNGKIPIIKDENGEEVSEHDTRGQAAAALRALYANMPEGEKEGEKKSGRRNSSADTELLRQARAIINELLGDTDDSSEQPEAPEAGEDLPEPIKEVEAAKSAIIQVTLDEADQPKPLNLSYIKSLGLAIPEDKIAVKSTGQDTIGGYVMLWGNPSLTDVEAEYFTKSTDLWDSTLGKSPRPLTWDHNQDDELKASPVIGQIVDFGDDEVGRWYEAKLERSHRYRKAIDALIEKGKIGTSSDSAPQYVQRVKTGKSTWLKTWPFFAAALTDTPAEPRMIGSLEFLKSIGVTLPDAPVDLARDAERRKMQLLKLAYLNEE